MLRRRVIAGSLVSDSGYVGWMAGEPIYMQKYETIVPCGAIGWNAVHIDVRCEDPRPFICEFYKKPCTNP